MTPLRNFMIWLGGAALVAATAVDTLAVIGRQVGLPLHGSIELIQLAVLVAGSLALVAATATDHHARVHLLIERIGRARAPLEWVSHLLSAIFFTCLLVGSAWLSLDLWRAHEISEIVGVPWRWMRLFTNLALAVVIAVIARQLFRGTRA